jgi:serine O-acetyltransferase
VHGWNIKIHPDSVIGARVGIMHDVTLGTNMERPGAPVIGDDVFIGAGARILGGVHIGNGARIAANSLVIGDVPAGATAVGVPARVMQYTGRPSPPSPPPTSPPPPLAKTAERRRADRRQAQQPVDVDRRQGPRRRPPSAGEH